jgi:hypothetical protein
MKRIIFIIILSVLLNFTVFSQDEVDTSTIDDPATAEATAQQKLVPVTVTGFQDAGFFYGSMSQDEGLIFLKTIVGGSKKKVEKDKERLDRESELGIPEEKNIIGIRVEFFKRGSSEFSICPVKPIPISGLSKTLSVWVVGRNFNHTLKVMLLDYWGNKIELTMGKLNFSGWKKLTVAIPPTIAQTDYHYTFNQGIQFYGLKVVCDPNEAFGKYYIYFDDLSANTDLFSEDMERYADDEEDGW